MKTKRILITLLTTLLISSAVASKSADTQGVGIEDLVFSHDSSQLIFRSKQQPAKIQFINIQTGKLVKTTPITIHQGTEFPMGFTPDGHKLTVAVPGKISILHNRTGKVLRQPPVPPPFNHNYRPRKAILNASGSQQLFYTLKGTTAQLHIVHTGSGKVLRNIPLPEGVQPVQGSLQLGAIGMSPNGRDVAYITTPNKADAKPPKPTLVIYDTFQNKIKQHLELANLKLPTISPISYSPDAQYIAIPSTPVTLIHLKTNKLTYIPTPAINTLFFSADSKKLALLANKNQLPLHDLSSGKTTTQALKIPPQCHPSAYAISLNKRYAAIGTSCSGNSKGDSTEKILLLNASSLQPIRTYSLKPTTAIQPL